jgi:hypothetical protein
MSVKPDSRQREEKADSSAALRNDNLWALRSDKHWSVRAVVIMVPLRRDERFDLV